MSSSDASGALPNPSIGTVTPAILVGSLLNFFFFGMLVIQTSTTSASIMIRASSNASVLYFILLLEGSSVCVNGWDVHHWFAVSFGDLSALQNPRNAPFYAGVVGGLNGLVV
ncbi:hypothetical protein B0H15DRAFT_956421 [Mycena belliarum]|uniref:Uncharacterized protein n=1 Tax=Mycena belliarum TaxID=1033014 RepID=A0AAD6XFA2_9AGAR|nr:hypothetical protein B0H15DRAFT_956421 [Mycena belliae]